MKTLNLGVVIALALTACGHTPTAGTVINRHYTAEHSDTWMQCAAYSSKGWCTVHVPITYRYPQRWELLIRDKDGDNWVDVDQEEYEQARPGMAWSQAGGLR